jgi:hypothetical protein
VIRRIVSREALLPAWTPQHLTDLMRLTGWFERSLAHALKIERSTLSRWLNSTTTPTKNKQLRVHDLLAFYTSPLGAQYGELR